MKHYFKWSTHIVIGLIIIVIALLLWRGNVWAPQTIRDIPSRSEDVWNNILQFLKRATY